MPYNFNDVFIKIKTKIKDLQNVDGIYVSHIHSDHTSGLPDMRAISLINEKIIPAYMPLNMKEQILSHYKFIFKGDKNYRPFMEIHDIQEKFFVNGVEIETFKHNHGSIDVQTYKIGKFAYSTDIKKFYKKDIDKLKNLDLWVVGLLKNEPHPSHAGFDQIMDYVKYINPKKTILTHMTALLDEKELISRCPDNVFPAHDGMEIDI